MRGLLQDIRYAIRQLRKNPGFTVTAVLTLALGIGAASAVFSVIYAVLIRPLPYHQPQKIFYLNTYELEGYQQPSSYPEYLDWRRENHVFSALAGFSTFLPGSSNLEGPAGPVALPTVATTDNFFDVFGVSPQIGRTFAPGEDQPGKNDIVVLSYEVWQQDFGGQRTAVGQTVKLNGSPYTVIGVMPAGFRFPVNSRNAIYTPLHVPKAWIERRGDHWLPTIARLAPGVTAERAQADMNQVLNDLGNVYPNMSKGRRLKLLNLASYVVGDTAPALKVLIFAVLAVLAIGCVNVAGLLLARGVKREREVALRSAVGATRTRLVRQMLTESLLLAVLGAAAGTLLAYGLLNAIRSLLIAALARGADVQMNKPVLLASLAIAVLTSLLAGLVPSLRLSRIAPYLVLKSGGSAGSSRGQQRLRASFIVTQVALALALLVVSGLLLRTLSGLRSTDLGFDPHYLLTTRIDLSPATYMQRNIVTGFYQPLLEKVRATPGVKDAGFIQLLPVQEWGSNSDVQIVGVPSPRTTQERLAETRMVTPGYFRTLGISLVRGRMLDEKIDTSTSPLVVVVNEAFVKKFLGDGEDPIGKHISDYDKATIVGVVRSVRQDMYQSPMAEMDFSISQMMNIAEMHDYLLHMKLVVHASVEPASLVPSLRHAFHEVDPGLPFRQPETMQEIVAHTLIFQRLENWLFGTFAFLVVLLAIVGLYGLISHEVELSTHDVGIRLALGATRARVLTGVYRRVGLMLLIGVTVGLTATMAAQKLIAAVVAIHPGTDLAIVLGLAAALMFAGLLAALIPARRAAKTDPMEALRYE